MLHLANNILLIRLLSGETQTDFGKRFNASKAMIVSYEKKKAEPNELFIARVARFANVYIEDLKDKLLKEEDIKLEKVDNRFVSNHTEEYIKLLKEQNAFLQKTVEANLNEVLLNQDILMVQTKVSMIRSAERYVKDDPAKAKAEIVRVNKLLLEYVGEDAKTDMILIDGKQGK